MALVGPDGRPLVLAKPEARVTREFVTQDVGHVRQELRLLAMATGVRITLHPIGADGHYSAEADAIKVEVYGREKDVDRYMDAVIKWSKEAEP